jgi:FixJ family two-component response regulator
MPATVLVVDDDSDFRGLAARMVTEVGLTVALVDVRLPDRSGIDLGTELAALPWSPRVVLISSSSGVADLDMNGLTFVRKEDLPRVPLRQLLTSG